MEKLVFDFDGTLVDSMKQFADALINVLKENNIAYPDDIVKIITPLGYIGSAKYFRDDLGLKLPLETLVSAMNENALREYTYNIVAKDTVKETLEKLKEKGYSLNVLTASPHRMLDVCLKRNGLYNLFDYVWSCEDFSTTKSDVNIYHRVAEKLGTTTDNCIFFDDNIQALTTAKESGMTVVGVYDESSDEYTDEIKQLCDKYVYKLIEFID